MSFYEVFGQLVCYVLLFWLLLKLAKGIWTCCLGRMLGFGFDLKGDKSKWAIVTGATDGLGLEFGKQLASKGYSLLLLSRTQEKLDQTKELIKSQYPKSGDVLTLSVDYSRSDIYETIEREISQLGQIEVLVNNVGRSYEYPEYFTQIDNSSEFIESIMNMNVVSCTRMIHLVLPNMEKRKRGVIINLSSYSAAYPTPLLALYAATKIYVDYLSRSLQFEYAGKGIIIQSLLPYYVSTKMSKIRNTSLMVPSPSTYVKSALNTVGIESRTYGYWTHKLAGFVQDNIISTILGSDFNTKLAFNAVKDVRRRYYKKHGLKEKQN